jgi:hypothetical protein
MKALDYILSHYSYTNYGNHHEKTTFKSLLFTLDKNELTLLDKKLKQRLDVINHQMDFEDERKIIFSLRKSIALIKENNSKGRNESIHTLLNIFNNKKSGRVCEVRKQIQTRYEHQSYQVQGKILKTFLHSTKADRKWAYKCLYKQWHNTLFNDILELWEKYQETECADIVIKYFPENYLLEHQDDFRYHYTDLCIRLINNPKFVMHKEFVNKFTYGGDIDVLYVNAMAKNSIPGKEALKVMFQWILITINSTKDKHLEEYSNVLDYNKEGKPLYFSTKYFYLIPDVIWCMRKLKLVDEIIYYLEWDNMVQKKFAAKVSGLNYINEETDYLTFLWRMQNVFYETVLEELPEEFRYLIDESKNKTYDNFGDVQLPPISDGTLTPRIAEINLQGSIEAFSKKNPALLNLMETLSLDDENLPF